MRAALDLGSLTQWYWSGGDWHAFLGRYAFHGFHWWIRRDHNVEWARWIDDAKRMRGYALQSNGPTDAQRDGEPT